MKWIRSLSAAILGDIALVLACLIALGLSIIDVLKLYEIEWFKTSENTITLFLVAFLIISVVIERRFDTEKFYGEMRAQLRALTPNLLVNIKRAGLRNFYSSRTDYARYRGASELKDYLSLANRTIEIVAYWLAHGMEVEGVARELGDLLVRKEALTVAVALVNPKSSSVNALASYLEMDAGDLVRRTEASLSQLQKVRAELPVQTRTRLQIKVYDTLPVSSVIMLDGDEPTGRIQVDMKLYRTPRQYSMGLEFEPADSGVFQRLKLATRALISDSTDYELPEIPQA